jgi:phage terminase large subunit-like protein
LELLGRPIYEPSKRRINWPNGAIATLYNAIEPVHDIDLADGSTPTMQDRLIGGLQLAVPTLPAHLLALP